MSLSGKIEFVAAQEPMTASVTKFGGQPVWLETPQWPLSRSTGKPMRFIGQVEIDRQLFPDAAGKMAYVFMTDEDDYVDGTWEADGGENAVIVQPGKAPAGVELSDQPVGPTLYDMVTAPGSPRLARFEREYEARIVIGDEPAYQNDDARKDWSEAQFEQYATALEGNKVGGSPIFLQGDEFPDEGQWRLLLQLDSTSVPFSVNFGDAGVAYAFIDPSGCVGKMLWQCS